jgi:hypothetical protein
MVKGFSWYIYKLNTSNTTTMSELDEIEMERQEAGGIVQSQFHRTEHRQEA